jgi:hypothetical protein
MGRQVCSAALRVMTMLSHVLLSPQEHDEENQGDSKTIVSKISKQFYQTFSSVASGKRRNFASTVNEQEATAALAMLATSSCPLSYRSSFWKSWWTRLEANLVYVLSLSLSLSFPLYL